MDLNKIQLIGRVGSKDELRYTKSDTAVISLSLATTHRYTDSEETTWHDITIFGGTAAAVDNHVEVGQELYVEGRLQKDEWTGDDGQTRRSCEVVASNVQFGQKSGGGGTSQSSGSSSAPSDTPPVDEYDDDIPF